MSKKYLSADKQRSQMNFYIIMSFLAAGTLLFLAHRFVDLSFNAYALVLGLALVVSLAIHFFFKPESLFPAIAKGKLNAKETLMFRRLRSRWVKICRDVGVTREEPMDNGLVYVHAPKVLSVKPVPLGLDLTVQVLSGLAVEDFMKTAEKFASAIDKKVRITQLSPSKVSLIVEIYDPLEGVRHSQNTDSKHLIVGRKEDGYDAEVDLYSQSNMILQGMTRSGKSALCYTIFSQLYGRKDIVLWGADPNRVLLEPLSEAQLTDSNNFVLGNDPQAFLELLTRFENLLNERMKLFPQLRTANLDNFSENMPLHVLILEEYPGLLERARAYDKTVATKDRIAPLIQSKVQSIASEGLKAGLRLVLIAQRADAEVVGGYARAQFGTRITMGVDNADAVRMLHPKTDERLVERVTGEDFPPGQCIFWQHRKQCIMQADLTEYAEYLARLGVANKPEPEVLKMLQEGVF